MGKKFTFTFPVLRLVDRPASIITVKITFFFFFFPSGIIPNRRRNEKSQKGHTVGDHGVAVRQHHSLLRYIHRHDPNVAILRTSTGLFFFFKFNFFVFF